VGVGPVVKPGEQLRGGVPVPSQPGSRREDRISRSASTCHGGFDLPSVSAGSPQKPAAIADSRSATARRNRIPCEITTIVSPEQL
jgi:hypothetical protein